MASSVMACTNAPGVLARLSTTEVRSLPVRAGGGHGRRTRTKRVRASATSATPVAMACSPSRSPTNAVATAASTVPWATSLAAAAVELPACSSACGRCSRSQLRTWAAACGWVRTVWTSAAAVPSRTRIEKLTASSVSATICNRAPVANASSVGGTVPSTEFSTGTQAASTSPSRTSCNVAGGVAAGTKSVDAGSTSWRHAASVNVPAGPK